MNKAAPQQVDLKARERRQAIEEAAYRVLMRDGYKATSILAVAKEAKASNETLYRWYGNKQGLFRALVERNAQAAKEVLSDAAEGSGGALAALERLAPVLLGLVTSEKAVVLNRAACGDVYDTKILGAALREGGRNAIVPMIVALLDRDQDSGGLSYQDTGQAAETFIDLLIGDLQIRRATGALGELTDSEIAQRSARALELFRRIHAPA